jgi:hypothetical protein
MVSVPDDSNLDCRMFDSKHPECPAQLVRTQPPHTRTQRKHSTRSNDIPFHIVIIVALRQMAFTHPVVEMGDTACNTARGTK